MYLPIAFNPPVLYLKDSCDRHCVCDTNANREELLYNNIIVNTVDAHWGNGRNEIN